MKTSTHPGLLQSKQQGSHALDEGEAPMLLSLLQLQNLIEDSHAQGTPLLIAMWDITKAFDSVSRSKQTC